MFAMMDGEVEVGRYCWCTQVENGKKGIHKKQLDDPERMRGAERGDGFFIRGSYSPNGGFLARAMLLHTLELLSSR